MEAQEAPLRVVSVLKSGGIYAPEHVLKIRDMLGEHLTLDHTFHCLSDMQFQEEDRISVSPLKYGLPGWWSKLELFEIEGPVFYLDLDTIIHKNIDDVVRAVRGRWFVILRDFYHLGTSYGSGLMFWEADLGNVTQEFLKRSRWNMRRRGGDQRYLERVLPGAEFFQDVAPGKVTSFKVQEPPAEQTPIVCFHGRPKPWDQQVLPY